MWTSPLLLLSFLPWSSMRRPTWQKIGGFQSKALYRCKCLGVEGIHSWNSLQYLLLDSNRAKDDLRRHGSHVKSPSSGHQRHLQGDKSDCRPILVRLGRHMQVRPDV